MADRWRRVVNTDEQTVYELGAFRINGVDVGQRVGNVRAIRRVWTIRENDERLDYRPTRLAEAKRTVEDIIRMREAGKGNG